MLIAHATANLESSDIGFIHGAALAAAQHDTRALLTVHVNNGSPIDKPVGLKTWLTRWGYPADHVEQRYISQTGYEDPADGLLAACRATQPDLLILPTLARSGLSRLFSGSVAEAVARNLSIPCLMLPLGGRKLVDEASGDITLERVLVLGGSQSDAQLGIDTAAWFTREVGRPQAQVTMLHAFDRTPFPETAAAPGLKLRVQHRAGELTDVVVMVCAELQPQLVVMVSHGHDQLRDVILANRTERVLRAAHRPLLWVPSTYKPPA